MNNQKEKIADIIYILCHERKIGYVSLQRLQKMIFFFEKKGIVSGLKYYIHFYGAYSEKLNNILYSLEMDGVIHKYSKEGKTLVTINPQHEVKTLTKKEQELIYSILKMFRMETEQTLMIMSFVILISENSQNGSETEKIFHVLGKRFSEEGINSCMYFAYEFLNNVPTR